jgi:integrative and conjugative element protein (TIGR02256 family)
VNDAEDVPDTYPVPEVRISAQARDSLGAAARASLRAERGGILIGHREGNEVVVEDLVEVPDSTAGRTTYLRREGPAQQALDAYLDRAGADHVSGYVGEWHTHPRPAPPSAVDHHAMQTMARRNRQPVALIVAALQDDHRSVDLHALISEPRRLRDRVTGRHTVAVVSVE